MVATVAKDSSGNAESGPRDCGIDGAHDEDKVLLDGGRSEDVDWTHLLGSKDGFGLVDCEDALARRHRHCVEQSDEIGREGEGDQDPGRLKGGMHKLSIGSHTRWRSN